MNAEDARTGRNKTGGSQPNDAILHGSISFMKTVI